MVAHAGSRTVKDDYAELFRFRDAEAMERCVAGYLRRLAVRIAPFAGASAILVSWRHHRHAVISRRAETPPESPV